MCCRRSATCNVPCRGMSGDRWAAALERAADRVLDQLRRPRPARATRHGGRRMAGRCGSNRSPPRFTSEHGARPGGSDPHLGDRRPSRPAAPSTTVERRRSRCAAGRRRRRRRRRRPARAGRRPGRCRQDPHARRRRRPTCDAQGRPVFGVAPTAKAARYLERDTGMRADTVAKLLHEWQRTDRPPRPQCQLPAGATVVVDEAGMLVHPRPAPAHPARRPATVAARPGRRPAPAAGRRPGRPVRRAVRQRPVDRARTPPPLHPPLGSRRVAAAATR